MSPIPVAMRIRLSDPALTDELLDYLARHEAVAERVDGDFLIVSLPRASRRDAATLELDFYLRIFEATHPGTTVERHAERAREADCAE
jgi:hypothetical protein